MSQNSLSGIQLGRVLTLAVGLGALAVGPVQAQPMSPAFGFQFHSGTYDDDNSYGFFPRAPQLAICLTDHEIRTHIANRGYSNIALNVPNNKRIQVRATKGGRVYLLKFNFCTDQIEDRVLLRAAK